MPRRSATREATVPLLEPELFLLTVGFVVFATLPTAITMATAGRLGGWWLRVVGRPLTAVCGRGPIPFLGALRGRMERRRRLVGNTTLVLIVPRPARRRALFLWRGLRMPRLSASWKATFLLLIPELFLPTAGMIRIIAG